MELLRTVLLRLHADRYELYAPAFTTELCETLAASGQLPEASSVLNETIARMAAEGETFDTSELLRLRGSLEACGGDTASAEASLTASIALAEQQGALSWRLRAEMSLARLRRDQGRPGALDALAATYARFTEGFSTSDLIAATRLLDGLAPA